VGFASASDISIVDVALAAEVDGTFVTVMVTIVGDSHAPGVEEVTRLEAEGVLAAALSIDGASVELETPMD
jgi:hypothetical protein